MEVVDIDLTDVPTSNDEPKLIEPPSVSFGGGIELLMNEKKKSSNSSTKIDLEDLDTLENELNDLSSTPMTTDPGTKTVGGLSGFSNFFGFNEPKVQEVTENVPLGQATKDTSTPGTQTWDGFSKMAEEIPKERKSAHLSEREKRRKKRLMIKKLEEWADKGLYKNGTHFTMDSDFDEVEDEYEGALEDKRKKDSIKLQGWWFSTVVSTLEYGNALVNPFDLNLDGWGEQVSEDLDSYEEIFSELYEKYKGGKMAPEVSLLLRLGFSAAVVNMSNKMLSSATPGFNDVIKQSPELMKMFSNAAVDTMSKQNSAFDFAKTMLNPPDKVNTSLGPPPAPVETKNERPPQRPGSMQFTPHPGNRPDLARAQNQTPMFQESGINIDEHKNINDDRPMAPPVQRPEMKGPQISPDISNLLSGLKTKTTQPPQQPPAKPVNEAPVSVMGDNSVVSLSSIKDLDSTSLPKKTKRRNNSSRNTVSLDI
jgi:hypothetical protein